MDPDENEIIDRKKYTPIPEFTIVFNLCNDPAYKYSLLSFGDKSEENLTEMKLF